MSQDDPTQDPARRVGSRSHSPYPPDAPTQVHQHHGIWQVRINGVFHGDFTQEEHARAAAARLEEAT